MRDLMFAAILGRYVHQQRNSAAWINFCLIASLAFIGCDGGLPYAPDAAAPQRPNLPSPESPLPEPVPVPAPTPSPDMELPVPGPPAEGDPENDDDDAENGDEDDGRQAPGLPPDPSMVAPLLSAAQETPFTESVDFLWNGEFPVQQGLDPSVFDERRIAVVRGRVWDRMGEPVAGVEITVQGQTEYGYTFTRADGGFDLAVNGGGTLVLSYEHPDYLPLHRQIQSPWADYAIAPDVVLTALDFSVSAVVADSDEIGPTARLWMPRPPQRDEDKTALKASIAAMEIAPLAALSRLSAKLWANTCQSWARRFHCTTAVIPCRDICLPAASIFPSQGHRCPRVCKRCR